MKFKKKTIIWECNNEPPKDYLWVKPDGIVYKFDYSKRDWVECSLFKCDSENSGYPLVVTGEKEIYIFVTPGQTTVTNIITNCDNLQLLTSQVTLSDGNICTLSYDKDSKQISCSNNIDPTTIDYTWYIYERHELTFKGEYEDEVTINILFSAA